MLWDIFIVKFHGNTFHIIFMYPYIYLMEFITTWDGSKLLTNVLKKITWITNSSIPLTYCIQMISSAVQKKALHYIMCYYFNKTYSTMFRLEIDVWGVSTELPFYGPSPFHSWGTVALINKINILCSKEDTWGDKCFKKLSRGPILSNFPTLSL